MTYDEMADAVAEMLVTLRKIQNLDTSVMQDAFIDQYVKFMEVVQFLTAVFGSVTPGAIDNKEKAIKMVLDHIKEQSIILLQLYETQKVLKGLG
jgi:hypothetical protein